MTRRLGVALLLLLFSLCGVPLASRAADDGQGLIPPIKEDILDPQQKPLGHVLIYPNYVELQDIGGSTRGAVGVLNVQGRVELFLVRHDAQRHLIGWAHGHELYNGEGQLVGYYYWTPVWSYIYDAKMKKVGQAQCIAYQGVCAAGVAGFLLGLL